MDDNEIIEYNELVPAIEQNTTELLKCMFAKYLGCKKYPRKLKKKLKKSGFWVFRKVKKLGIKVNFKNIYKV